MATITFIDYGNRALVEKTQLAELPAAVSCEVLEGQAKEFQLALVKPPADEVSNLVHEGTTIRPYNWLFIRPLKWPSIRSISAPIWPITALFGWEKDLL